MPKYHPSAPPPAASSCGFTLAADYVEGELDINRYLVRNPLATFFFAVEGDTLVEHGIRAGDVLVVDRSITPRQGHIVVAFTDGERLVGQLHNAGGRVELLAGGGQPAVRASETSGLDIWGVVIGQFKRIPA